MGRSFLTEEQKCDSFFTTTEIARINFFCVHIPNAIKVTKFRNIPMKLWFLKFQNRKCFSQKWPKSTWWL